ncbi:MAG: hypothetical protein COA99_14250 [Moraxellaceae bacterium]|nr:MAG: hypothetical protein COA99_14250 [Moraxellaceae bacterium]
MLNLHKKLIVSVVVSLSMSAIAQAENRTLFNLERERSTLLNSFTSDRLTPAEREQQINMSQRHLMDMERMVIRDDRLLGLNDPVVQRAFDNYDTTFLVHASVEANQHIVDFWLQQLKLDSKRILSSKKGRR